MWAKRVYLLLSEWRNLDALHRYAATLDLQHKDFVQSYGDCSNGTHLLKAQANPPLQFKMFMCSFHRGKVPQGQCRSSALIYNRIINE